MKLALLYVNSHHEEGRYVFEAEKSAASFRKFLPRARYYLYTDLENFTSPQFDEIRQCEFSVPPNLERRTHFNGQMKVKHQAMQELEEDSVLLLGSDTYALRGEVTDMPRLLERFDIAVAHAPLRINIELGNSPIPDIPASFPEFNCDVILYRNSDLVRKFLRHWQYAYLNDLFGHPHDQGTFRYLIYNSDLRIATLPPEFNYRGWEVRDDTVILQNRYVLEKYESPHLKIGLRQLVSHLKKKLLKTAT